MVWNLGEVGGGALIEVPEPDLMNRKIISLEIAKKGRLDADLEEIHL